MATEAEFGAQESEREYSRIALNKMAARVDNANAAIEVIMNHLRLLGPGKPMHNIPEFISKANQLVKEWENMNGY